MITAGLEHRAEEHALEVGLLSRKPGVARPTFTNLALCCRPVQSAVTLPNGGLDPTPRARCRYSILARSLVCALRLQTETGGRARLDTQWPGHSLALVLNERTPSPPGSS